MPQIDLVTGFLGSGKTTFIKDYAGFLISQGLMVGILENDYGAINIDMAFLQDLMGNSCDVEMVVGGDGILSHQRRFQTKLISMMMTGYDRVIVEPSGIYDTDEFFDAFEDEPLRTAYSPGSVIAIVDADLEEELSEESEYMLVSQTANAGKIVLSNWKEEYEGSGRKEQILAHLNRAMERFHCDRRLTAGDIIAKDWKAFSDQDYADIALGGMIPADHVKLPLDQESGYGTLFYYGTKMDADTLRSKIRETFEDPRCGNVLRIKGFVHSETGERMQINATRREMHVEPTVFAHQVLIITGEKLNREKIDAIWAEASEIITPGTTVQH